MKRTFAAFIIGWARRGRMDARSAVLYVGKRTDSKSRIIERMDADLKKGNIDRERRQRLWLFLEGLYAEFVRTGRMVDDRTPREWEELGNGARRKKIIKDSETDGDTP